MRTVSRVAWTCGARILLAALCLHQGLALAQTVGEVEFSRGAGFAQKPGQPPRALGKGLQLQQGDRLATADGGTAIVRLQDGTRMTLRPKSEMVVQQFEFQPEKPQNNSMVMQLLSGGLRAVTGLISKGAVDAAKIQTITATVGIRGTDFDARLCGPECKTEAAAIQELPRANAIMASAKLINPKGEIHAIDVKETRRRLAEGASVYPGDVVETGPGAQGVLVFRDESRMTLGASTRFKIDAFAFDAKNPEEGKFLVSLVRGSLRALTGLIGKANKRNVGFTTATSTIGIRGTGLDLDCGSSDACSFYTWLGSIEVTAQGQTALQVLQAGEGLYVGPGGIRPLTAPTIDQLPRPDNVPVNVQQLFSTGGAAPDGEGLYVYVRDGHIEVSSPTGTLHLGRGETGFADASGQVGRPQTMPLFIQFDSVPLPNSSNPLLLDVLNDMGLIKSNSCR